MKRLEIADALRAALDVPADQSSDFDLNAGLAPRRDRPLRAAGVLVPIVVHDGSASVLLTKRSSALRHHPGQVAFPGGKVDAGDAGPVDAALRETEEEVGLSRTRVEVLGSLASHATVTGFEVTPVIGLIEGPIVPVVEVGEVDEAFEAPFHHVTDPARFRVETRLWQGVPRRYYAVPIGPYYIWGATARILRGLADRLNQ